METDSPTVRAFLRDIDVRLAESDRVEPPLWTPLQPGLFITVFLVSFSSIIRVLKNTLRTVGDEFLAPGEGRIITKGADGLEQLTYLVSYDGPVMGERKLIRRQVVVEPREAVQLVGTKGSIPSVPITGTIAYIVNGDA